jgi:hypothetical protein
MPWRNLGLAVAILFATVPTARSQQRMAGGIPLDLAVAGGRPVVTLHLNGHASTFILDTGASYNVILADQAALVGARFIEETTVSSPLGSEGLEAQRMEVADVQLGSVDLGAQVFAAIPNAAFPMPGGTVGVLSASALARNQAVVIDFSAGMLALSDEAPAGLPWSPINPADGQMEAQLQLGDLSIPVHLDTGSPGTLLLPSAYAEQLGLSEQLRTVGRMRTVDAERDIMGADFQGTATLGGLEIPLTSLSFADVPTANVGMGVFGGHQLIVDRGGQQFALLAPRAPRRPAAPVTAGGAQMQDQTLPVPLGVQIQPSGSALQVAGVGSGSRAERAGLLAGDQIVAINGKAIADIPMADMRSHLAVAPLMLTVRRGDETIEIAVPEQ